MFGAEGASGSRVAFASRSLEEFGGAAGCAASVAQRGNYLAKGKCRASSRVDCFVAIPSRRDWGLSCFAAEASSCPWPDDFGSPVASRLAKPAIHRESECAATKHVSSRLHTSPRSRLDSDRSAPAARPLSNRGDVGAQVAEPLPLRTIPAGTAKAPPPRRVWWSCAPTRTRRRRRETEQQSFPAAESRGGGTCVGSRQRDHEAMPLTDGSDDFVTAAMPSHPSADAQCTSTCGRSQEQQSQNSAPPKASALGCTSSNFRAISGRTVASDGSCAMSSITARFNIAIASSACHTHDQTDGQHAWPSVRVCAAWRGVGGPGAWCLVPRRKYAAHLVLPYSLQQ